MPGYDVLRSDTLSHLEYFTEWGGPAWERLVRVGIVDCLGGSLEGKNVLEIGARYGKMSCLFGLLGANVTGIDIHSAHIEAARAEAGAFDLESTVHFMKYGGDLRQLSGSGYDLVFAKSVLWLFPNLKEVAIQIDRLLATGAEVLFIENALGGPLLRLARKLKHAGRWDYSSAHFMTSKRIDELKSVFRVDRIVRNRIPPIYLIGGGKKPELS
jgi:SAM-dependent methyltransferase